MEKKTGIELIAQERKRQIDEEGFTTQHDDQWIGGELAMAACCYAQEGSKSPEFVPFGFPWDKEWWKPTPENRVRELVKAGALIAAEIDRIQKQENL